VEEDMAASDTKMLARGGRGSIPLVGTPFESFLSVKVLKGPFEVDSLAEAEGDRFECEEVADDVFVISPVCNGVGDVEMGDLLMGEAGRAIGLVEA